jgi:hypothetical protein
MRKTGRKPCLLHGRQALEGDPARMLCIYKGLYAGIKRRIKMLKISTCSLCGKFYRTGQIRQMIVVSFSDGFEPTKKRTKVEDRILVCLQCHEVIEKKGGIDKGVAAL